jgi:hypothetical protein
MPGFAVDIATTMTCPHGGKVTFVPAGPPTVFMNGKAVMTAADQITVIGCSLSASGTTPCAKVQWTNLGVALVNGKPVLLQAPPTPPGPGGGLCVGSATPAPPLLMAMQPLVAGT